MSYLNLKPTHKAVKTYYESLKGLGQLNLHHEGVVAPAFASLLRYCGSKKEFNWIFAEQFSLKVGSRRIVVDGAFLDTFHLVRGYWEAKDINDDLKVEVKKKFDRGYPKDNIIFQAPDHIIVWQDGSQVFSENIQEPQRLIDGLKLFFEYQPPAFDQWNRSVEEFKVRVPELAQRILDLIETERKTNQRFINEFSEFSNLCRSTLNPNLSTQAIEEMLIQHLLTARIFNRVFQNPDFIEKNAIANKIEQVILALTSKHFSKHDFLRQLDRFYGAIETTASTINDYSQKQHFLNSVYEKFFQGFSVKVADTHGIVYTPQPVVDFMVKSVEIILKDEFGKSLSDENTHILDPFVGTGNFIIRIMREIQRSRLTHKYKQELHCNEVLLLPYYIASMNIEHEFYEITNSYEPFNGICLVDTFELAEETQPSLFSESNTIRVQKQKSVPIFVIIGNPPYNMGQVNENDNNKNRKYKNLDQRITSTYAKDSNAKLLSKLSDPYVKAYRWATDRLSKTDDGIVAFISNNSFVDNIAFDGMRKHLLQDYSDVYILNLGGNVRKNPKLSGTTHNVFGIKIGVSINFLIKRKNKTTSNLYYYATDEYLRKEEKYSFLNKYKTIENIEWKKLFPDQNNTWLLEGYKKEFDTFPSLGSRNSKENTIFNTHSCGVMTSRDAWNYSFDKETLISNVNRMIEKYNVEVWRYKQLRDKPPVNDFLTYNESEINWSRRLKRSLIDENIITIVENNVRICHYRPFVRKYLYFDRILNEEVYSFPNIYPTKEIEVENKCICVSAIGTDKPFHVLMINNIADYHLTGDTQCFPLYLYDNQKNQRNENITDWALDLFQTKYVDLNITKEDIFNYVYALLHHPIYKTKYSSNLRRALPRIPMVTCFRKFVEAGRALSSLHANYSDQTECSLNMVENRNVHPNWRIEKMKLSKDKTKLYYNEFLTLENIPPEAFEYMLGNRSALEWIVDQYRIKTDKRSGIVNDPNRIDDPEYIVRLIKKIVTVSVETVRLVKSLPELE